MNWEEHYKLAEAFLEKAADPSNLSRDHFAQLALGHAVLASTKVSPSDQRG